MVIYIEILYIMYIFSDFFVYPELLDRKCCDLYLGNVPAVDYIYVRT
jgi:hypothetical protein